MTAVLFLILFVLCAMYVELKEGVAYLESLENKLCSPDTRSPTLREATGDTCPRCEGTGEYQRLGFSPSKCALCNGTGHV